MLCCVVVYRVQEKKRQSREGLDLFHVSGAASVYLYLLVPREVVFAHPTCHVVASSVLLYGHAAVGTGLCVFVYPCLILDGSLSRD